MRFLYFNFLAWQVQREQDFADGYRMNLSFSEWWTFKTPFYAWFSRNFESMVLPLLWEWGFTHGHDTRRYCLCFFFFSLEELQLIVPLQDSTGRKRFATVNGKLC